MKAPGTRENDIASEPPKNPGRPRAIEAAEAEPAPRTSECTFHNLRLELSSFVGREKELAEVKRLLADTCLLTLPLLVDVADEHPSPVAGTWRGRSRPEKCASTVSRCSARRVRQTLWFPQQACQSFCDRARGVLPPTGPFPYP